MLSVTTDTENVKQVRTAKDTTLDELDQMEIL